MFGGCVPQAAIPVGTYVAGVVTTHVIFALLEKKRLENWQEKGEVSQSRTPIPFS